MTKKIAGEANLLAANETIRLRLEIGSMLDLEDHFEVGSIHIIDRLQRMKARDLAVVYLAMTGKSFHKKDAIDEIIPDLMAIGLSDVATALAECLTATLIAGKDGSPGKRQGMVPGK